MTDILIPPRLHDFLRKSPFCPDIESTINNLTPFLSSELYFFPEYTDHGPAHIASTLAAADYLIPNSSLDLLTPDDIAALILATLLHDSAMHLSCDCFLALIDPTSEWNKNPLLSPLDTKPWPALFDDFFADARRWDGRTLHNILGDAQKPPHEEEDLYQYIKRPDQMSDPDHWPPKYRKFLAEFLRKHHGRLAHEFALHGLPLPVFGRLDTPVRHESVSEGCTHPSEQTRSFPAKDLSLPSTLPPYLADLAGLIARSHTMSLRDTFDYLETRYGDTISYKSIHPIYLMSLLRIADYLQLQSDRTNPTQLVLQRLRSPLSNDEWNKHFAIDDIKPHKSDAESLYIHALPESARDFLSLRKLLAGLQSELDTTFAVLGEVYSRQTTPQDLSKFSFTLRRVRSNLDNPDQYVKNHNPPYYPLEAKFDTAGPDLLKLLIRPLYGDRPEIGVRELLQNALDAVHELRHYCKTHNIDITKLPFPDQKADVLISIDKDEHGDHWLTVTDKGIGMTAEVIRDYFLKAGASYRDSEPWRRQNTDETGKSTVLRSGYFGIGAMAAFLLGSRIHVVTRHIDASPEDAVEFFASLTDDSVVLRRTTRPTIGTTVRVLLTPSIAALLDEHSGPQLFGNSDITHCWDWYVLDDPTVERRTNGEPAPLSQAYHLPAAKVHQLPSDWRRIDHPGFLDIQWTYSDAPYLSCNGIQVLPRDCWNVRRTSNWHGTFPGVPYMQPSLSVFDPDRQLQLTLTRDALKTPSLPFANKLLQDVTSDLCAFLLVHCPQTPGRFYETVALSASSILLQGQIAMDGMVHPHHLFATREGTSIAHPWHMHRAAPNVAIWVVVLDCPHYPPQLRPSTGEAFFYSVLMRPTVDSICELRRAAWLGNNTATAMILSPKAPEFKIQDHPSAITPIRTSNGSGWRLWGSPMVQESQLAPAYSIIDQCSNSGSNGIFAIIVASVPEQQSRIHESSFTRVWQDIMRHPVIPYDPDERKKKFAHAYEQLAEYIEVWQTPNLPGWRGELLRRLRGQDK